ncbi:MAG: ATP-binding protein [Mycoplasmataceae bacterium]|nr:ATP-binding protein [Mycoplasmataceae bacterium]MBR2055536.1 ATP-binding protein [Mycoplasmataceae bacterium]MBR2849040.1 ATP-binding protein [Mycoplasmataceae bacterium]MBR3259377.1 ATP-binding protein [Mycoplasmataceae bacterium]
MNKFDQIKNKILENEHITKIIKKLNLNYAQIESGYDIFLKIIEEQKNPENLEYITKVEIYDENTIIAISVPNSKLKEELKRKQFHLLDDITKLNESLIFENKSDKNKKEKTKLDKNIFYWEIKNLEKNDRLKALNWLAKNYIKLFIKDNIYTKGIYLYGGFGVGKTYFLMTLANYSINKEKSVIFVNSSELYDYMKKNVEKNNDLNSYIIDKLKNVDVLIIDDIGNEKQSNWFLFSILYPIFTYRYNEEKIVCFSSIFSLLNLKKYWLKSKELDSIKVERLIDKINSLTNQIELSGENVRDKILTND